MALNPIEILINAKDNASGVFDRLNNKLKVVGVAIAGYFGIKAFAGIVEGAADFEQALSRVKAATGASAEEMERLKQAAQDAGANTKYTSTEAAAALENLAKAGLSAGDAIETLPAVLSLAQAGDIELATSAEYVTKAVMGMGLAFSDAGRVADVLALGANATNTSVAGLAQALSYAAPTANSLGVSLESTVAIIGKFADAGIDASRAGTALNSIMSQFSDPASKFRRELGAAGITTNNFEDALHQLADAGPRGAKAINAVGLEAGPALKALLNQGMPALDELKAKLDAAAGSAAATAKTMEDNLKGSMTGLASAWDTVKNVLGTPVLPAIKDGVDQLAGALRSAVSDGTIQKFGEAIAAAFKSGITWIKAFAAEIDFTKLAADLRAFADRTGEVFTQVGEYATNAGNIVKIAYGVMSAGVKTVLAAVYGIGSGFSEVAGTVMKGVATLREGLAKISFGGLSKSFSLAAEDARSMAKGFGDAAQAMRDKAKVAMQEVADSAQTARAGFAGLATSATDAKTAVVAAAAAQAQAAQDMDAGAAAAAAAGVAYQKKAQAEQAAAQVAEEHAAKIKSLSTEYAALLADGNLNQAIIVYDELEKAQRGIFKSSEDLTKKQKELTEAEKEHAAQIKALEAEYAALRASGNVNEAIIVFDKLVKTQREVAGSSKAAAEATAQIEAAFSRLGVTSTAVLKEQAVNAQRDYDIIKVAGTSTAQDIAAAFKVAAEKAIAANNGIAPSWVQAQAAARGYVLEVDAAGKTTVKSMKEAEAATKAVGAAAKSTADNYKLLGEHAEQASAQVRKLAEAGQMLAAAEQLRQDIRNKELEASKFMNRGSMNPVDAVPTFNSREEADAWLAETKKQYQRDNPFTTKSSGALGNAGMDLTMAEWRAEVDALAKRDAMKNSGAGPGRDTSSTQSPNAGTSTTTVNITVEGTTRSINTDAQGAATLQELVRQLAQAKGTALR